jgi:uncharacterized protein
VLVLLPPSEGKTAPGGRGRRLDLQTLSFPQLTDHRKRVLEALIDTSARPDALEVLEVGGSLRNEVERNTRLAGAPTAPAHAVYSGVLFDALGWPDLDPGARRRGGRQLLIASALWGWVRPNDRIPAYRLSMTGRLDGPGPLASHWRPVAVEALREAAGPRGLVVDCRSAPYANAAPVPADLADRAVAVRVLREADGVRSVVSHLAKHTRGQVTRWLLTRGVDPRSPQQLAAALSDDWTVELSRPRPTAPWTLDVIER